ncbi:EF-hand domain-containing protein [Shimia sp. SDUM112013]|uniref:EF-hand domain-containing protein n=1 Tax=Shimia sp. SDUM112013 TaxID=3136160 RepID=UPI0032EAFAE8
MKRAVFITGIVAAALAVTAVGASAKGHGHGMKGHHGPAMMMNFDEIDANKDGKITQDEMDAFAQARFDKADTNGDGLLSTDEMQAQVEEMMKQRAKDRSAMMMARKDANGDGQLSFEEMSAKRDDKRARMIEKMDADKDGAVSKEEFEAAKAKMAERHGKHGKKGGCDRDAMKAED